MKPKTTAAAHTIRVWGLAAGRGTTAEAARGAFTCREYPTRQDVPKQDWLTFVTIEEIKP